MSRTRFKNLETGSDKNPSSDILPMHDVPIVGTECPTLTITYNPVMHTHEVKGNIPPAILLQILGDIVAQIGQASAGSSDAKPKSRIARVQ